MSVIAKMIVRNVSDFGSARLVEMSCICDNDLMTTYAESHEDKLFTKYSPWGEIKLHQPAGWQIGEPNQAFYVMILHADEVSNKSFPGAYAYSSLAVASITDFGDEQAKRLEMTENQWNKDDRKGVDGFNWKMSVDNPAVFAQLKAGKRDYFVAFYPASSFDRDASIKAAHGGLTE